MSDETMTDIGAEIKRSFDLAVLRHEANRLRNADDWQAFQAIRDRYADERAALREDYQQSYDDRFTAARAELLRKAGENAHAPKPRFAATDRFNREAIDRQAHRIVRLSHQSELARLEEKETRELNGLLKEAGQTPAKEPNLQKQQRENDQPGRETDLHTPVGPERRR